MARVFLLNPPAPEPVRSPLLAFGHLAASLRAAGHEVSLLDASAPYAPRDHDAIDDLVAAFRPDLVGLHLKTLHAQPAYGLSRQLAKRHTLVAGGPHATVCPDEPFHFGFQFVVRGEGEPTLVELADAMDGRRRLEDIAGLSFRGPLGPRHNEGRGFILDLDALASPVDALGLFDPAWYGANSTVTYSGLLASRGCPAACTFCSNNVTGRRFRYRSAESIAQEIARLHDEHGLSAFSFFDDSFAVGRRRMEELCSVLVAKAPPVHWTCTAHPAHLDLDVLRQMKQAGCGGVDLGIESGDPGMLLRIGKGVTVDRVLQVLAWARELGLHTVVNLMFGWPDETEEELQATLDFMQRAAPLAGGFNARGVVVPYPGTDLYDRHHQRFGFTDWWIRELPLRYRTFPTAWSREEVIRTYAEDAALERNFFRHPPGVLSMIREGLHMKAALTFARIAAEDAATHQVPAAGAR